MRALIIALLAAVAVASLTSDKVLFNEFKAKNLKVYGSETEESLRFAIFRDNLRVAERYNAEPGQTAVFGVTKFMDLTATEFRETYLNLDVFRRREWARRLPVGAHSVGANHSSIDWRTTENPKRTVAVSKVKDQGSCGSCWAFSAAAAIEACVMLGNGGKAADASAQQIVDCCHEGGSDGCYGGWEDLALEWATKQNIYTWDSYPYTARDGTCHTASTVLAPKNSCRFYQVQARAESKVQAALESAPLSIALAANVLQTYSSGVLSGSRCSDSQVNHAVFLVAIEGSAYTVKNSWGASWGEKGYFRMATDVNCLHFTDDTSSYALPA